MSRQEQIIAGLVKLARRKTPWIWSPQQSNTIVVNQWWRELIKRKPHLQEIYDEQRRRVREKKKSRKS